MRAASHPPRLRPEKVRELEVSAASGLCADDTRFFVAADDEPFVLEYAWQGLAPARRHALFAEDWPRAPAARKRVKADLESLTWLDGATLLALGSGSLPTRRRGALFVPDTGAVQSVDLGPLYDALGARLGAINLEGAAIGQGRLWLLQRGDGASGQSAVIALALDRARRSLSEDARIDAASLLEVTEVALGTLGGTRLGFTDACWLPGRGLCFSAAAEDSADAVADGPCAGSVLGLLDERARVAWSAPLEGTLKIEGLFARPCGDATLAWLVADADDPGTPSPLLRVALPL